MRAFVIQVMAHAFWSVFVSHSCWAYTVVLCRTAEQIVSPFGNQTHIVGPRNLVLDEAHDPLREGALSRVERRGFKRKQSLLTVFCRYRGAHKQKSMTMEKKINVEKITKTC